MCGFTGYFGREENNTDVINKMVEAIRHRGPDSQAVYEDEKVSLGFARLSIIDLEGGTQPMTNEDDSMVLVFNGEIYNYQDIRKDLLEKGHIFKTNADTEVIIHGYEEYGQDIVKQLRGMFAFVIWDKNKEILFGARDHFGIKPFYYYAHEDKFMFGSEIKSFLANPSFKKEFDETQLADYLTFSCVPGYNTFFKHVLNLPPGHTMTYNKGDLALERYFNPLFDINPNKTMDEFVSEIQETVTASVEAHKISDVEVGCFLSGGVDSSYVVKEAAKDHSLRTYTVGFEDQKYSEIDKAKVLAKEVGVENYSKYITADEYFDHVNLVQYHMDEPLANPSGNLLYFLAQLAAKDVKVVMSGEGADEMFGGYNVYKEPIAIKRYQKIPLFLRKAMAAAVKPLPEFKGKGLITRISKPIEKRYIGNSNLFTDAERKKTLKGNPVLRSPYDFTKQFYDQVSDQDDITKMQYLDINVWMVQEILQKADKMSMANSLELRVPLLDTEIFKLSRTIPVEDKVSAENTKLAFREAANRSINNETAMRTKKAFPLPLVEWLQEDQYYEKVKTYFQNEVATKYFNQDYIMHLLDVHKAGKKNYSRKIWAIFTFLVWYEEYFQKR